MMSHRYMLLLGSVIALAGCGPATPEARVQERAAVEFHCSEGQIEVHAEDAPTKSRMKATGCGREAVYINVGKSGAEENWVLAPPNQ